MDLLTYKINTIEEQKEKQEKNKKENNNDNVRDATPNDDILSFF